MFERIKLWFSKNWKWFLGLLSIVGALIALYFLKNDITEFLIKQKKVSLAKNKRDIQVLEKKKELVKARIVRTEDNIKVVDSKIENIKKKINKDVEEISSLTINSKLRKFDDLGY